MQIKKEVEENDVKPVIPDRDFNEPDSLNDSDKAADVKEEMMMVDDAAASYFMNDADSGVVCQRDERDVVRRHLFGHSSKNRNGASSQFSDQGLMCLSLYQNWDEDEQVCGWMG